MMPVICAETAPLMLATRPSTIDCSTAGVMEVVAASRVMDPAAAGDSVAPGVPGGGGEGGIDGDGDGGGEGLGGDGGGGGGAGDGDGGGVTEGGIGGGEGLQMGDTSGQEMGQLWISSAMRSMVMKLCSAMLLQG